jgi:hypothetical protein
MGGVEDVNLYSRSSGPDADTVEVVSEFRGYWTGAARVPAKGELGWAGPPPTRWPPGPRPRRSAAPAAGSTAAAG